MKLTLAAAGLLILSVACASPDPQGSSTADGIDEMLTPDSSRFWPASEYEAGRAQKSFDKQFVRDHLDAIGWDHNPPAPGLTADVVSKSMARYREAHDRLFPHRNLEKYL